MHFCSKIFYILALMVVLCSVSACGKVSSPVPLEGSGYPHSYPRR